MQSLLDTDGKADDFGALLGALATKPALFEDDVQRVRHVFYRQGAVDRRSAAQIFHANRVMRASNDCWTEFYLEALVEFFLDAQRDGLVLPADKELALLTWLGDGISLVDLGERRLILRVFLKSTKVSERFERRLFAALRDNLLHRSERWLGGGARSAGVIDALDMHLIRRLVCGDGEFHPRKTSRTGIEFLIDIDRNALRFTEPRAWRHLMIDIVARHRSAFASVECEEGPMPPV